MTAQVGRGATSIVYRGVDEMLGRSVAVKVFDGPRSELNNPERQLAEMRALAAVDHPNLVAVYDAHVADGDDSPYLILELVAGTTLSALLADGPLPPNGSPRSAWRWPERWRRCTPHRWCTGTSNPATCC